jgi:hypothetical protein
MLKDPILNSMVDGLIGPTETFCCVSEVIRFAFEHKSKLDMNSSEIKEGGEDMHESCTSRNSF